MCDLLCMMSNAWCWYDMYWQYGKILSHFWAVADFCMNKLTILEESWKIKMNTLRAHTPYHTLLWGIFTLGTFQPPPYKWQTPGCSCYSWRALCTDPSCKIWLVLLQFAKKQFQNIWVQKSVLHFLIPNSERSSIMSAGFLPPNPPYPTFCTFSTFPDIISLGPFPYYLVS